LFQAAKAANKVTGAENEKNIVGEAERLDIKEKAPLVLAELLLDTNILTQIKTYRTLFLRVSAID
jgi:translation initiation factor 5